MLLRHGNSQSLLLAAGEGGGGSNIAEVNRILRGVATSLVTVRARLEKLTRCAALHTVDGSGDNEQLVATPRGPSSRGAPAAPSAGAARFRGAVRRVRTLKRAANLLSHRDVHERPSDDAPGFL